MDKISEKVHSKICAWADGTKKGTVVPFHELRRLERIITKLFMRELDRARSPTTHTQKGKTSPSEGVE